MHCPTRRRALVSVSMAATAAAGLTGLLPSKAVAQTPVVRHLAVRGWPLDAPAPTGIHDVAPAPDGGVWFTAQRSGYLGHFDPVSGRTELVRLGVGSSPHGVIQGPDNAAWITDGGQNAIVRVGWPDRQVQVFRLPAGTPYANLNTCAFDGDGNLFFTGQTGFVGKLALRSGVVTVEPSPRGRGPYGICATPSGDIWYCSLAGSFIARLDRASLASQVVEPPTPRQGARRVWSDRRGRIWVSEWHSGNLSMYDPAVVRWRSWKCPGDAPRAYAVYVDGQDIVWVSEWAANVLLRFDPVSETFEPIAMPRANAAVRQILGRPGEVWLPESGTEFISVVRTG